MDYEFTHAFRPPRAQYSRDKKTKKAKTSGIISYRPSGELYGGSGLAKFRNWNWHAVWDGTPQGVLGIGLSRLLRSSIAQSAAMVSRSLMMWVALTLPKVAGVRVGSSKSRTCFETVAVAPPESNCLIASIVAKRCAVVSFIASRFL